jgi:predicted membrane-bound spermidine synthase
MNFFIVCFLAFMSGFISLSYEIFWFRIYFFTMTCSAKTFGFLLYFFLFGVAIGAYWAERFCRINNSQSRNKIISVLAFIVFGANCIAYWTVPILAYTAVYFFWQLTFLLIILSTTMFGAVLPLLSHAFIEPDKRTGSRFSYIYLANILGAVFGVLLTGHVITAFLSTRQMALFLIGVGFLQIVILVWLLKPKKIKCFLVFLFLLIFYFLFHCSSMWSFEKIYEKLLYKTKYGIRPPLTDVLENRHGVIVVDKEGTLYGNGVYDGVFSVDLINDRNIIFRAYAIGILHQNPEEVLIVGLGSGSWAKVVSNIPSVKKVIIVEINPGYIEIVSRHPETADILKDPKVHIIIDDARRWLRRNSNAKFDVILANITYNYVANVTNLLSTEFLDIIDLHLKKGGIYYYNTTHSLSVQRTGMLKFEYGLRIASFLALSHSPIIFDNDLWIEFLKNMKINSKNVIEPDNPAHGEAWHKLISLIYTLEKEPKPDGMETRESLLRRTASCPIVTDDNMGMEFQ